MCRTIALVHCPITVMVLPVRGPGDPADAAHGHRVVVLVLAAEALQGPAARRSMARGAGRARPAAAHCHGCIADGRNRALQQESGRYSFRFCGCSARHGGGEIREALQPMQVCGRAALGAKLQEHT